MLALLSSVSTQAALYYVRADGTAASAADAIGPANDATHTMNLAVLNQAHFNPGDTIRFSNRGGAFTTPQFHAPFHAALFVTDKGTAAAPITYEGIAGEIPLIDVSESTTSPHGIAVIGADFVQIRNFDVKGSGGAAAVKAMSDAGISGYGVAMRNVRVLSSYGASSGDDDCFSLEDTAEVEFFNVEAHGCREAQPPFIGSHQAITAHRQSRFRLHGGIFSDANYVVVNVADAQGVLEDISASGIYLSFFETGLNATANALIDVRRAQLVADRGAAVAVNFSTTSTSSTVRIQDATIIARASHLHVARGIVEYRNNKITVDAPGWLTSIRGGSLRLIHNDIVMRSSATPFIEVDPVAGGSLLAISNTIHIEPGYQGTLFSFRHSNDAGSIENNVILGLNDKSTLVSVAADSTAPDVSNNTLYNSAPSGSAIRLDVGSNGRTRSAATLQNNIAINVRHLVVTPELKPNLTQRHNIVVGSDSKLDGTDIAADPHFIAPGTDFTLRSDSPAIDAGVSTGTTSDHNSKPLYGVRDIGAFEWQPTDDIAVTPLAQNGRYRIYSDGKLRVLQTSSTSIPSFFVKPSNGFVANDTQGSMDVTVSANMGDAALQWRTDWATPTTLSYRVNGLHAGSDYVWAQDCAPRATLQADAAGQLTIDNDDAGAVDNILLPVTVRADTVMEFSSANFGGSETFTSAFWRANNTSTASLPTVILFPGFCSSPQGSVVAPLARALQQTGYNVAVIELPRPVPANTDAGAYWDTPTQTDALIEEAIARIKEVIASFPSSGGTRYVLGGFDLGANFAAAALQRDVALADKVGAGLLIGIMPISSNNALTPTTSFISIKQPLLDIFGEKTAEAASATNRMALYQSGIGTDFRSSSLPCAADTDAQQCHRLAQNAERVDGTLAATVRAWLACAAQTNKPSACLASPPPAIDPPLPPATTPAPVSTPPPADTPTDSTSSPLVPPTDEPATTNPSGGGFDVYGLFVIVAAWCCRKRAPRNITRCVDQLAARTSLTRQTRR